MATPSSAKKIVVKKFEKYLEEYFGYKSFRDCQREIIEAVVKKKRDVSCVMPTGHGKSLCYQIPPLILEKPGIIISPLLSLMEDQRLRLHQQGISCCCYNSTIRDKSKVNQEILEGKYRIIYITPETIVNSHSLLKELYNLHGLSLIAIDESHCVSLWGQSFREDYTKLSCLKEWFPKVPVMALTGTATPQVEKDIIQLLNLQNPLQIRNSSDRPNLSYYVHLKTDILSDLKPIVNTRESMIIYCQTIKDTGKIADLLQKVGIKCEAYYAGLATETKTSIHHDFLSGEITCIAATNSFGMGIDKANIYTIIHYGCPKDIESYCQEAGRAGRNGNPSQCHIFYADTDFAINRSFIKDLSQGPMRDHKEKMISAIEKYLYTTDCRRQCLLNYFGETIESQPKPDICCDNCQSQIQITTDNWGPQAMLFLELIQETAGRRSYGKIRMIDALRGALAKIKDAPKELLAHRHYGAGSNRSQDWWRTCVQEIANQGLVIEKPLSRGFGSVIELTQQGIQWVHKNQSNPTLIVKMRKVVNQNPILKKRTRTSTLKSIGSETKLSATIMTSYNLFQSEGQSIAEIAKIRELQPKTIEGHINSCAENGLPIDLKRLDLDDETHQYILNIIQSSPLNGDTSKLKPIKENCRANVTYPQISLVIALMKAVQDPELSPDIK